MDWLTMMSQKICRCCLSENELGFTFESMDCTMPMNSESYAEMLSSVLGLVLHHTGDERLICRMCVMQLQQAATFHKKVQISEGLFLESLQPKQCKDILEINLNIKEPLFTPLEQKCSILTVKVECDPEEDSKNYEILKALKTEIIKYEQTHESASDENETLLNFVKRKRCNKEIDYFHCDKCKKKFTDKKKLLTHINSHQRCRQCRRHLFKSIEDLNKHIESGHKFFCPNCEEIFMDFTSLARHKRNTHWEKSFRCRICNKTITCRAKLDRIKHFVDVHGGPKYKCGICTYECYRKSRIEYHTRKVHMGEKNVLCPVCGYKAFDKSHMTRHMRTHAEKTLECAYCKKMFKQRCTLLTHERIHTGDKRQVCKFCGEKFVQRASLKYHLEKYHPGNVYRSDNIGKYCNYL